MTQKLRIGIYGGAFDPPHNAHVGLAVAAVQQLQLDVLYIVPTGQPWMKQRQLTSGADRLLMAQLAFKQVPHAQVSDLEIARAGTTYTIDTVHALQSTHPHADWFLVMGQDLLQTLPKWQRAETLFQTVTVAVLQRPDDHSSGLEAMVQQVRTQLPVLQVVPLNVPPSTISSTQIRQYVQQNASHAADTLQCLQTQVPPAVAHYIQEHHLYPNE